MKFVDLGYLTGLYTARLLFMVIEENLRRDTKSLWYARNALSSARLSNNDQLCLLLLKLNIPCLRVGSSDHLIYL